MAKFQPIGLEWMNKGLKPFNKGILETAKLMNRSANDIKKVTLSMKNLNKETGEWYKRTVDIVAGTDGVTETFTTMERKIDDAGDAITTTDETIKRMDGTARGTGGRGGGVGILTAAISGLSAAVGLFLLNALKNLIKFGLKAIVQALILPIKGFIELGKVVAKITFAGFKAGAELVKNVLMGVGEAASWAMRKIASLGATMLQAGIDFQEGWTGIKKAGTDIVDAAGNITELGRAVREDFIDLIREVPLLPEEILRIGELGAQLDIPDEELARFSEVVAAVTKATVLSAEDAALGMGKVAAVMGLSVDDFERMGSVIVWLGNNMGIVEDEILLMAKRVVGMGEVAGWSTAEILGISAAVLRLGATPYAGASAVQRGIQAITVAVGLGGEKLEMFAALAGMTSDDFIQSWRDAPAETFLQFIKGLTLSGEDAILLLDELGLANVRTSQSYLSLAARPEELDKALTGSNQAWIDNTALAREAQLRYETVASKIQLLKNQFSILGLFLFDFMEPVIRKIISVGGRLVELVGPLMTKAFERLQPVIDNVVKGFDFFSAVLTRVLSAPNLRAAFDELLHSFNILGEQRTGLLGIFDDIAEMVGGIGTIDWGVVEKNIKEWFGKAIDWVIDNWPDIKKTIEDTIQDIKDIDWDATYKAIIKPFMSAWTWIIDNWPEIKKTVIGTYNDIVDFLFGPVENVAEVPIEFGGQEQWERTGGFIDGLIAGFGNFKQSVDDTAKSIRENLIPSIKGIITNVAIMFGAEADIAEDPYAAGKFVITELGELIEAYGKIYEDIAKLLELMTMQEMPVGPEGGELPAGFPSARPVTRGEFDAPEGLGGWMTGTSIWDTIADTAADVWEGIWTSMAPLGEAQIEYSTFVTGIETDTEELKTNLVGNSIFPEMMAAILAVFETGLAEIGTLWSTFWTGATTEADTGANSFLAAMGVEQGGSSQGLLATIERSYSSFKDAGKSIVQAIADGMSEAAYLMVDALRANIDALNVTVDTDEAINDILFDIGEKITQKIANAIYDSYVLIYDALELALSLGGQLMNAAQADAEQIRRGGGGGVVTDVVDSSQQVVTNATGAVTAPTGGFGAGYTPAGLPQYSTQGEAVEVNINVGSVRDDMDMAALETIVRRTIAEEIA